jgi:hypothetical protein
MRAFLVLTLAIALGSARAARYRLNAATIIERILAG